MDEGTGHKFSTQVGFLSNWADDFFDLNVFWANRVWINGLWNNNGFRQK